MIADEEPLYGEGHNQPPSLIEGARAAQRAALETYRGRRDEFLKHRARVVRDRQSAADAADVIKMAAGVWKLIEADRLQRSNPYRDAANAVADEAANFWAPVVEAMSEIAERIETWSTAEDKRIEAQRQEQELELEALRAAAAPPASIPERAPTVAPPPIPARRKRIRGDLGAMVATTERKEYAVEDWRLLPDWLMNSPTVLEAIATVVRQTVKHMGVPPGIKVSTVTETNIR